jgi:hypothetical protein
MARQNSPARNYRDGIHPRIARSGPHPAHSSRSTRTMWRPAAPFSTDLSRPSPPERRGSRHRRALHGLHQWTPDNGELPFFQAQGDVALKLYVASVYFKCFRCFRGMLQVFYMGIAIVDRDVAHVAIVVYICCKRLFQLFHLFFICMLHMCLFRCYICFTHMLQVFYLDVAYVLQ